MYCKIYHFVTNWPSPVVPPPGVGPVMLCHQGFRLGVSNVFFLYSTVGLVAVVVVAVANYVKLADTPMRIVISTGVMRRDSMTNNIVITT